jgi:hypothetical protein
MTIPRKKSPWKKRILWSVLLLVLIGAGIYWYVATEKFSDTNDREAAYTVTALDFIREFHANDSIANVKYRDKIITVTGTVSAVEPADSATMNIKFIDTTTGSYAIFAFQEQHAAEARNVKEGDVVSIKGSCSGGSFSEILEVEKIDFKRSALNKTKHPL